MLLSLLSQDPREFILVVVALILSLSFHEFAHAFVADRLGDGTPRAMGRYTLNPLAHLDPVGSLFLLVAGFGWGKPVPINPFNFKNPLKHQAFVALAGPMSNFILAIIVALIIKFTGASGLIFTFLYLVVKFNLFLGFFNLIPFGPLDGFKIIQGFLPGDLAVQWAQMEKYGFIILLVLVITNATGNFLAPLVNSSLILLGLH